MMQNHYRRVEEQKYRAGYELLNWPKSNLYKTAFQVLWKI